MQKWEYLWIEFLKADSPNIEVTLGNKKYVGYQQCDQLLNELGEQGWELAGTGTNSAASGSYLQFHMIFKRPIE